jgi:hypothetical protein
MKSMRFCVTLILSAMTATGVRLAAQGTPAPASAPASPAAAAPVSGPIIKFDNDIYDFGKAVSGEKVRHTYIVTNTGTEMLQITNVHPGCGCTTTSNWTHDIAPGQTGEIPVQFNSANYGSQVAKTIDVFSNAKNEPHKVLRLKGLVWKPLEVSPATAMINIPPDGTNALSTTVRIINKTDNPVTVSNVVSANKVFETTLKETKPGKEFELVITIQPPFTAGNVHGAITIYTSQTNMPTLTVTAIANATPAVQITPPQIVLNQLPDRATTNRVTIMSSTTNVLSLSNAKASDSRIQVDVQPTGRKGMFSVIVVFPAGFQLAAGQKAEVTVESNHPRFPLIRIPVMQFNSPRHVAALPPRPSPAPVAAHP